MLKCRNLFVVFLAALTLAGCQATITVSVITQERWVLTDDKLFLPCEVEGDFDSCTWVNPKDVTINPDDLDPMGNVSRLPGSDCGIIVESVHFDHQGDWKCAAVSGGAFAVGTSHIVVKAAGSWPGVTANITSSLHGSWGTWGRVEICPPNSFADALNLKAETPSITDSTGADGVMLFCREQGGNLAANITSTVGEIGEWRGKKECAVPEYINRFKLRVLLDQGNMFDDSAVNDIKFTCTHDEENVIEGGGEEDGEWDKDWVTCPADNAICGIQTRVEEYQGMFEDDSGLNDIVFLCCPYKW
ncbi:vitelline membrane outer layer protein 1 homolog [Oratosquilla oratoria]|uniref:vitelline membrane outer layer protein 1 homolog n=1 Tax=Oratosquilla oratoria TaxID=337810 RepID=UPI003F75AD79